jgi:peptidoglycan/LPS O-acetylase OafA/YrhL
MVRHARALEMAAVAATAGQSGVDLFFVLSGLLIYRICIQESFKAREYTRRRLVRIYPTFFFVLALYICIMLAYPFTSKFPGPARDSVPYILSNLLLLPGLCPILPIITVAWSLSYELAYYIAMPFLRLTLRINRWSSIQRSLMAVTAVTWMIVAGTFGFGMNLHIIMFPAGIIVYELSSGFGAYTPSAAGGRWMDFLILALVISILFAFGFAEAGIWHIANLGVLYQRVIDYIALAMAFSLLVYRCLSKRALAYSIFSWYPLRWLGKISYSFYLFHGLILHGCFRALNAALPNYQVGLIGYLLLLPSLLLVAVVSTWPLFVFVESPFSLVERKWNSILPLTSRRKRSTAEKVATPR